MNKKIEKKLLRRFRDELLVNEEDIFSFILKEVIPMVRKDMEKEIKKMPIYNTKGSSFDGVELVSRKRLLDLMSHNKQTKV